jgi:Rieske 2Fe-2S family protein
MKDQRVAVMRRAEDMGIPISNVGHWPWPEQPGAEPYCCERDATMPGYLTGSEDGLALAPFMGDFTDFDGGFTYFEVGPSSFFLAYPDHGLMYHFMPKARQKSEMEITWLVRDDAREGQDYDLDRLIWMWDVTSIADKRIIDHNQRGINSRFYKPGPYQEMESAISQFVDWYLSELKGND